MHCFGRKQAVAAIYALICVFALSLPGTVQASDATVAEKILDILRERQMISDTEYEALKKEAMEEQKQMAEAKDDGWKAYWKDGMRMESEDGDFKVRIGGRLQTDFAAISASDEIKDVDPDFEGFGTEFRRVRLFASGSIYDNAEYKVQFDFAGDEVTAKDFYVGLKDVPALGSIRVGHQKEPFSLEEQTSSKYYTFMERALPNVFAPGRNTGVKVGSNILDGRMTWSAGIFEDTADGEDNFNNFDDFNVTGRITGTPWFQDKEHLVHLGLGASYQFRSGGDQTLRYRQRPEVHLASSRTVDTGSIPVDNIMLLGGEAAFVYGPFSLQGEYMHSFVDASEPDETLDFSGAYVYASYFLTGESRAYSTGSGAFSRVKPFKNFSWDGGWGAWELAARWSYLDLSDDSGDLDIEGGEENNFTVGLNWYLNPSVRWMLNYVHADIEEGVFDDGSVDAVQTRVQIDF